MNVFVDTVGALRVYYVVVVLDRCLSRSRGTRRTQCDCCEVRIPVCRELQGLAEGI